jgi:hypothetical protein
MQKWRYPFVDLQRAAFSAFIALTALAGVPLQLTAAAAAYPLSPEVRSDEGSVIAREAYHHSHARPIRHGTGSTENAGIVENVSPKYIQRYEKWKAEFTSTGFGRRVWDSYASRDDFTLTITVTPEQKRGAGTGELLWDSDHCRLIGATISLGPEIDQGFPAPIYYPVLNSIEAYAGSRPLNGRLLAAAKLAHEFGHVGQVLAEDARLLLIQKQLVPVYATIFRRNGANLSDPWLSDLAAQMGGTPIEIWESREYGSEFAAMQFLSDRLARDPSYCGVFARIRRNVNAYASTQEKLFGEALRASDSVCNIKTGLLATQAQ